MYSSGLHPIVAANDLLHPLHIRRELQAVRTHRAAHRSRRQDAPIPVVALVGYTNAGKSTLLNTMTDAGVLAEDKLFATLDPTTRKVGILLCDAYVVLRQCEVVGMLRWVVLWVSFRGCWVGCVVELKC
jgi:hypothetical protein